MALDPNRAMRRPTTLTLGHNLSSKSHYQTAAATFAQIVTETTDHAVEVLTFPESPLGGDARMIEAVRLGFQDLCICSQAPMENTVKQWQIFDLPYLFSGIDQANHVLSGEVGQRFLDMLLDYEMLGLGWLSAIERDVCATRPIRTLADLAGLKMRVLRAPGYLAAYQAFGAIPAPLAYHEVYVAIKEGRLDGIETSPDQFIQDGFIELCRYFSMSKVHHLPAVLVIGTQALQRLTDQQQLVVRGAGREAVAAAISDYAHQYRDGLAACRTNEVDVIEPDLEEWQAKGGSLYPEMLAEIPDGQELFEAVSAAIGDRPS